MKLKDKVVVVTGGGSGIGRAMCLRFAREGAAVVVNYSKSKTQADEVAANIEGSGGRALAVQANVSIDRQARQLISQSVEHFGRLDLLINNAGWTRFIPHHDLESLSEEVLENTWGIIIRCSTLDVQCLQSASGGFDVRSLKTACSQILLYVI